MSPPPGEGDFPTAMFAEGKEPPATIEPVKPKNKRKTTTGSRGTAIELRAKKHLESKGYVVHRCVRTGVKRGGFYFSQSNDIFGCIDLIAKRQGSKTLWVQVTMHSGIGVKSKEILGIPWDLNHDEVEIWRWVGGAPRKHKVTGVMLDRQFYQIYRLLMSADEMSRGFQTVERIHVRPDGSGFTPLETEDDDA